MNVAHNHRRRGGNEKDLVGGIWFLRALAFLLLVGIVVVLIPALDRLWRNGHGKPAAHVEADSVARALALYANDHSGTMPKVLSDAVGHSVGWDKDDASHICRSFDYFPDGLPLSTGGTVRLMALHPRYELDALEQDYYVVLSEGTGESVKVWVERWPFSKVEALLRK